MSGPWSVYRVPASTHTATGKPRPKVGANAAALVVRNPACPEGPHPTRTCGCRFFRIPQEAEAYAAHQNNSPEEGNHENPAA